MELPLDPSSSLPFGIVESSIESCSTESDDARRQIDFSSVYTVGEKLGSGTFGNVHRCTHRVTREERAVKIIDLTSLTPNQKKRSIDEARICEMLDHENVVRLDRLYQNDSSLHFIFELVSGGELFDEIVLREHYSEQNASDCMRQVLSAICHCHKLRVVHRDLKPENILLGHKPIGRNDPVVVKVADFGLAFQLPDGYDNVSMPICGTPYYIAPETLRHRPIGTAVDMWACGVLLYILLAGYHPVWAKQQADLFEKTKAGEYEFRSPDWDNVSASAKSLVRSMLTVHPTARITASEALTHPWICMRRNIAKTLHRKSTLKNLKNFNALRKFRCAVLTTTVVTSWNRGRTVKEDRVVETDPNQGNKIHDLTKVREQQGTAEFAMEASSQQQGAIMVNRQDSNSSRCSELQVEGTVAFNQPFAVLDTPDAFPSDEVGRLCMPTDYDDKDYLGGVNVSKRQKTEDTDAFSN